MNNEYQVYLKQQSSKKSIFECLLGQHYLEIVTTFSFLCIYVLAYTFFRICLNFGIFLSLIAPILSVLALAFAIVILIVIAAIIFTIFAIICSVFQFISEIPVKIRARHLPLTKEEFSNLPYKTDDEFISFLEYCCKANFLHKSWYVESIKEDIIKIMLMYLEFSNTISDSAFYMHRITEKDLERFNISDTFKDYLLFEKNRLEVKSE